MKTLRLRRGEVTPRNLAKALDSIGVRNGDEFVIASRASYVPGEQMDSRHAVRGKREASALAAARVWPKTGTARRMVIDALLEGPATREQIRQRTMLRPNTIRPRVLEAIDGGWIQQCARCPYIEGQELLELTDKARRELGV